MIYAFIHKYDGDKQTIAASFERINDEQIAFDVSSVDDLELVNGEITKKSDSVILQQRLSPIRKNIKDLVNSKKQLTHTTACLGRTWQCDKSSLDTITSTIIAYESGIKDLPKFWRDINNENFEISDISQLKSIAKSIHDKIDEVTYKVFELKDKIESVNSQEELYALHNEIESISW